MTTVTPTLAKAAPDVGSTVRRILQAARPRRVHRRDRLPGPRARSSGCSPWRSPTAPGLPRGVRRRPASGATIGYTVDLALGLARHRPRARHAAGVGCQPAAAAAAHPARPADPADRRAGDRQRRRLGVPAVAASRLPQRALRQLPWWSHLDEGPIDIYTLPWIVIITGLGLTSFVYLFVSAGFENINAEHLEAAQVSGSSPIGVFFRVTLPLLRPTLIYGGGVALLLGLGQFTAPLLLGRTAGIDVLTTEMYTDMSQTPVQYGSAAALGSPLLVFGVIVVAMQKVLLGDRSGSSPTAARRSAPPAARPSSPRSRCAATPSSPPSCRSSALVIVSLSHFWSAKIDVGKFTLDNFRQIFDESSVTDAIYNSVTFSLIAVLICLPVGFVAASVLVNGKRFGPLRAAADFIVAMPLGVPAVMFGVGFLLTYTEGPFVLYGTHWVVILVYVTLMLPFATRMQLSALVSLGDTYVEAARVSGSSVIGANLKVILPLMRSAFGGAAALMFVLLTHEFAASVLVRSSTTQVMGTVLFDYWSNGSYPLVAAIALVMSFVTAIGVVIAVLLGGSKALSSL